jgi:hypothetical protein
LEGSKKESNKSFLEKEQKKQKWVESIRSLEGSERENRKKFSEKGTEE